MIKPKRIARQSPLITGRPAMASPAGPPQIRPTRLFGLALLLLLSTQSAVVAQPLDTLLALLPAANPELRAMNLEYRAALQMAPQVNQLPDPELKLGWFTLPPETRLGPQRLWLIFNQMLPWPGKLEAQEKLALDKAAPLLEKIAARQLVLEQSLKKVWLKLYRLYKLQEVIENQLEVYDSWEQVALSRVENNRGSSVDVYRLQLQQKEMRQRITTLEIEKSIPQAEINRLLGRVSNSSITFDAFLGIPELPLNLDELLARVGNNHPMLRIYELEQAISRQALELNRLDAKPDFTVGIDYFMLGKRTDADPVGNGRDIVMPHIAVSIPLNRGKYRAKEQEEALRVQALDQRKQDQLNTFNAMVEMALTEYLRAQSEIAFVDEQVYLLRTTIRVAQSEYSSERRPFEDLLKLQEQMISYRERNLAAIVAMHNALADLQFYLLF